MPKTIDKKEVKARLKTAKTVMRVKKAEVTRGMAEVLAGTSKDVASIRAALSTFSKASVEAAKFKASVEAAKFQAKL